ncbi:MAG: D-alanyl-D-alanine carboxypeptidase [Treponema sp.]|nr:D-alanyl-D-alanine carboxypeptidase [Treponema sp.]
MKIKAKFLLPFIICLSILGTFCGLCIYDAKKLLQADSFVHNLQPEQELQLKKTLDYLYPERSLKYLSKLPYSLTEPDLTINAGSAILIDNVTGSILYEKNAEELIPPASLTKIVEMYVLFQAIENNEVSLDDIVPLPPQSWSENLPYDASRMYLGKGHRVTLKELMLGLAIASGNDASIAAAYYVCNSMDDFVKRMNKAVSEMELPHTHFVESSGYSEKNITTAKEFATFARMYINKYPEALENFHSKGYMIYPQAKNLPPELQEKANTLAVKQYNTNKLIGKIPGCDGLKTGFINESGYNIAVTAERNGNRFLSVTMRGPGHSTAEGNQYRVADNLELFKYAFSNFADYHPKNNGHEFPIGVAGSKQKFIKLVPAYSETFTVPFITGSSPEDAVSYVHTEVTMPRCLFGNIIKGEKYGTISYKIGNSTLRTVPLVADRDSEQSNFIGKLYGKIIYSLIEFDFSIKSKMDTNS